MEDQPGTTSWALYLFIRILFIYHFSLCWAFVAANGRSLVVVSGGFSLAEVCGFLTAVAPPGAERGLCGVWASVAVAHGLSCPVACRLLPDQGLNSCPLHWRVNS